MKPYKSVKQCSEAEYTVNRSRFIGRCFPVDSEEAALCLLGDIRKKHWDATHNCFAYRIGDNAAARFSDDGEPGGTAGNPILEAIKKNALTDVVIVVTRYFGGIKLGAGGLIRAYGHAAVLGIEAATRIEMTPFTELHVTIGYDLLATVEHWIRQQEIRTEEADYAEAVTLHLLLPPAEVESRLMELRDLTSANFQSEEGATRRIALPC